MPNELDLTKEWNMLMGEFTQDNKELTEGEIDKTNKLNKARRAAAKTNSKKNLLTIDNLPKTWEENILKLYRSGKFDEHIKIYLAEKTNVRITPRTWERFLLDNEEFASVIEYGRNLSFVYWMELGERNMQNNKRNFDASMWRSIMINKFGWKDSASKRDISHIHKNKKSDKDIDKMNAKDLQELATNMLRKN